METINEKGFSIYDYLTGGKSPEVDLNFSIETNTIISIILGLAVLLFVVWAIKNLS